MIITYNSVSQVGRHGKYGHVSDSPEPTEAEERVNYVDCDPVMGFNTKQWWIYDNEHDMYVDPPVEVLTEVEKYDQEELQEQALADIIDSNPGWLQDKNHWYGEKDFEI